ncbi:MAG: DoxX family protein [Bacteroidetes bacterium]|nr:MAG: DoxX family protein [Bacteroidota bacterium]
MKKHLSLVLRVIVAAIFLQTLYFKFTGAPESVYIFTTLGAEPAGRILSGILELVCAVLLLYRPTMIYGALGSLGVISGALLSHLFVLGIEVMDDGGLLFGLALTVFLCSLALIIMHKSELFRIQSNH